MILPSSKNSSFPLKVRFKSCVKHNNGCLSCPFETCSKEGNYDMHGWRYDELIGYPVDTTQDPRVVTKSSISLLLSNCDFYTLEPPESVVIPIL